MEVADDGDGGATADADRWRSSHGMANMADRVSALDGEIVIHSPAGHGTRLVVTVPCG